MRHLKDNNISYGKHCLFALAISWKLSLATLVGIIHALIPYLFQDTVSNKVKELNELLQERVA